MSFKKKKTYKSAVVIIPPEECWPPIQAIRGKIDTHFRRWMPHINLLYPFRPRDEFEPMAEKFNLLCRDVKSFDVTLGEFRSFSYGKENYTLWLAPQPKETLMALQNLLWRLVPDCNEVRRFENGFTPHLSVGQSKGKGATEALIQALQETWKPIRFTVKEICMIWRNDPPDDVFRAAHKIALKVDTP
ncbi:MAG: 2'-5' RNA ligase family protein [Candidatus Omnitrophica bacterium]|nr:2'-5' RNA ligase family protein [Candidatus Omnitrophota bacterium]